MARHGRSFMMNTYLRPQRHPEALNVSLVPDAIITQTNLAGAVTDIDDAPDAPDANWLIGSGAVTLQVSFPSPTNDLVPGAAQEFRVLLKAT